MRPPAIELTLALLIAPRVDAHPPRDETPIVCHDCEAWNRPRAPVHLHGNTDSVGVAGLSSVLVTTSAGLVLIDGGLPQSASLIAANLVALGRRPREVRYILTSHAHFDHVGGVAALRRRTGACVVGSAPTVAALAAGAPTTDDPQSRAGGRPEARFPAVAGATTIRDGETLTLGDVTFTAHLTPGHTPGATTWTWRSCEVARCVDVVYADSLNAISDEGFRFTDHPGLVERFRRSIDLVERLPCDVLVTVHPDLAARDDPRACRTYAERARQNLEARVAMERELTRARLHGLAPIGARGTVNQRGGPASSTGLPIGQR